MRTVLTILLVIVTKTTSLCDKEYSVKLQNFTYNGFKYNLGEYYAGNVTGEFRGCVCMKETCARKCCPLGQAYHMKGRKCVDINEQFKPPVWKESQLMPGFNATEKLHFLIGKQECSKELNETRIPIASATKKYHLRTDGNLFVEILNNDPPVFIYEPDKYCIDTFISDYEPPKLNALICFVSPPEKTQYGLNSTCMLISCFFILLTVAVYAWLPDLRNLHGMVLIAYLLSFFVGFLFLATMQILLERKAIYEHACTVFAFIIYFSLLSAFFWLNVMCYDIWWTFSGKRAHGQSSSTLKRFMCYAAYAFGVPTLLTILLAALEFSYHPSQHPLLPKLRLQGCFLYGKSKLLYLYVPIVILVVANMTFFTLTAFKIAKVKRETQMLRDKNNSATHDQHKRDAQRFTLYIKLFTVMGINWILEVVSSFYPDGDYFWQFTDAFNVLVGLLIFIIFVCKEKTFKMIKKRYKIMRGLPMSRTQTTSTSTRTTSSQCRDEIQMNSVKRND